MSIKLGVIGCGKMSYAILNGLHNNKSINIGQSIINDIDDKRTNLFAQEFNGIIKKQGDLIRLSDVIILAVKPNEIENILKKNLDYFDENKLIISIAAGIKIATIENLFNSKFPVVRAMPNTPALIGEGVTAITGGQYTLAKDIKLAEQIFNSMGKTYVVEEKHMDAVTAISGSGPAYVYLIVETLINSGVSIGLDNSLAKDLVIDTIKGSIAMIEESSKHPAQLLGEVCSPAGTTIAAIKKLEEEGLRSALYKGVNEAFLRAQELGLK
ncbi:MAG TPA: pyrroline-5-carboxylate reductase [Syntrophomonadaceae bacterium]|nr:pyrroline-5-carboxylate reductase [Syntrophomonadaceae bacterium]